MCKGMCVPRRTVVDNTRSWIIPAKEEIIFLFFSDYHVVKQSSQKRENALSRATPPLLSCHSIRHIKKHHYSFISHIIFYMCGIIILSECNIIHHGAYIIISRALRKGRHGEGGWNRGTHPFRSWDVRLTFYTELHKIMVHSKAMLLVLWWKSNRFYIPQPSAADDPLCVQQTS